MKKTLLLLSLIALTVPAIAAEYETTTTRQFVPFTEAIDRAKLQEEADSNYAVQTLQKQREEVQTKVNNKKEAYEKQQSARAKRRAEIQKQNEEQRQRIQSNIDSTKSGILLIQQNAKQTPEEIRKNNAEIFTNLMNETNPEIRNNTEIDE